MIVQKCMFILRAHAMYATQITHMFFRTEFMHAKYTECSIVIIYQYYEAVIIMQQCKCIKGSSD